jgi:hypothetical protein
LSVWSSLSVRFWLFLDFVDDNQACTCVGSDAAVGDEPEEFALRFDAGPVRPGWLPLQ